MAKQQLKITKCKAFGQPIHFAETRNGQKKITVITVMGDVVSGWESHFANCPGAEKFRKKKES